MKIARRKILAAAATMAFLPFRSRASRARSPVSAARVVLIGYGQSNMGTFFSAVSQKPNMPPIPNANTYYYNGARSTNPALGSIGDGIVTCMNEINNVTGLPVLSLNGAVGGSGIGNLTPGGSNWTNLVKLIDAVIQPADFVVMLWDQGEGDAANAPHEFPQDYIDGLANIQQGLATATGRADAPILVAGLGTTNGLTGQPSGGNTPRTWQTIKNAHFFSGNQIPYVHYSHTNIDILRADGYHYTAPSTQKIGQRFGQGVTTLMGHTSGFAHWEVTGATTVDATHTNVTVATTLGNDFSPTRGEDGWEVSEDNGANWTQATGEQITARQLQLTHPPLETNSARLVRYQWGYNQAGNITSPTSGLLKDNSTFALPLTPTTWDVRPTPLSVLPMPTWRNVDTTNRSANPKRQSTRKLLCFPSVDNYQKFLILAVYSGFPIDQIHNAVTLTVAPDVGSPVNAKLVAQHSNRNRGLAIFQALLGPDANTATYLMFTAAFASDPFTSYTIHVYDVSAVSLSSQAMTGHKESTASFPANAVVPISNSCTVRVNEGGFIICMNTCDQACQNAGGFARYSSNFNERWEDENNVTLDAANCAVHAASPFSISMQPNNGHAMNIHTLMASWR